MKKKHVDMFVKMCLAHATASECVRRQHAAIIVNPRNNSIVNSGYNGGPRGGSRLCGGEVCTRDAEDIPSGTQTDVGCAHAERNAVYNAAFGPGGCSGAWMFCTGEPCAGCAEAIHHSGIAKVIVVRGGQPGEHAVAYLRRHGVEVELWTGEGSCGS